MVSASPIVPSHPNRNWRRRLNAGADRWSTSREAEVLAMSMRDASALRQRLRLAYLAGLRDGERREIDLFDLDRKK